MSKFIWDSFDDWTETPDSNGYYLTSPVFSIQEANNLIKSNIELIYPVSSCFIQFRSYPSSFNAENSTISWTQISTPNNSGVDLIVEDMGHFVYGLYFQIRILVSDAASIALVSVDLKDSDLQRTFTGKTSYINGVVIAQNFNLDESKIISKINLNLHTIKASNSEYFSAIDGVICFSCCNFQYSSNPFGWVIDADPVISQIPLQQGFLRKRNMITDTDQPTTTEVLDQNDYVRYDFLVDDPGIYDIYIKSATTDKHSFYIRLDTASFLSVLPVEEGTIDSDLTWNKIGFYNFEGTGLHSLYIYSGNDAFKLIDAIYLTKNIDYPPIDSEIQIKSPGPFNTYVLIQTITGSQTITANNSAVTGSGSSGSSGEFSEDGGGSDNFSSSYTSASSWVSSILIGKSGLYSYDLQKTTLSAGAYRIQFRQIGGNDNNFVAWDCVETDSSTGLSLISTNYGSNFSGLN